MLLGGRKKETNGRPTISGKPKRPGENLIGERENSASGQTGGEAQTQWPRGKTPTLMNQGPCFRALKKRRKKKGQVFLLSLGKSIEDVG